MNNKGGQKGREGGTERLSASGRTNYRQRKMEVEEGQERERECTALGSERMEC